MKQHFVSCDQRYFVPLLLVAFCAVTLFVLLVTNALAGDEETIAKAREAYGSHQDKTAVDLLKPLAERNNPEAMLLLSTIYGRSADPSVRDGVTAESLLDSAVELNYPPALATKGRYYLYMVDKKSNMGGDPKRGIELLERASELGDASASLGLVHEYYQRKGSAPNVDKAFLFAQRALDQGSEFAVTYLARFYRDGIGAPIDRVKAYAFFQIGCYRPDNDSCTEARKLRAALPIADEEKSREIVADEVQEHPGLTRIQPPLLNKRLLQADKAELADIYAKVSPLHFLHEDVVARYYTDDTRVMMVHIALLEIPWRPKGWGSNHARWPEMYDLFMRRLEQVDARIREDFRRIVRLSGSLVGQVAKELSDEDLRDLIALYQSPLGEELRDRLKLVAKIQLESAKEYWQSLAASGRSLEESGTYMAESYRATLQGLPMPRQRFIVECDNRFITLINQAGLLRVRGNALTLFFSQGAGTAIRYEEWNTKCVKRDYHADRVMEWLPVKREVAAINKWEDQWRHSAQMKDLHERYRVSVQKLLGEGGDRLKPPPPCPEGYWLESKFPGAPCVEKKDRRRRN